MYMRTTRVQDLCELAASACASGLDEARRREISLLMDAVAAADLGLPDTAPAAGSVSAGSTIITQTVYASDAFELVVFLFPRGVRLPLHDHRAPFLPRKIRLPLRRRLFPHCASPAHRRSRDDGLLPRD